MTQEMGTGELHRPAGTEDLVGSREPNGRGRQDEPELRDDRVADEMDDDLVEADRDPDRDYRRGEADGELQDAGPPNGSRPNGSPESTTLFSRDDVDGLRARWVELQAAFVDEPRSAVQRADELVAEVMQTMAAMLSSNKHELEGRWQREGTADTENLRQAMRQYRSFFDKLLHV